MSISWKYMPILKWKRGEQASLQFLTNSLWSDLVPMIELLPIDAAPDTESIRASLQAYTDEVAGKLNKSVAEESSVAIDTRYMSRGYGNQLNLLFATCRQLIAKCPSLNIVPVVNGALLGALATMNRRDADMLEKLPDVVLRLGIDEFVPAQVRPAVDELVKRIKRKRIHLVLDQFALVGKQEQACFNVLRPYLDEAILANCASVTIAGGSFPVNLMGKKQGVTDIPRVEWKIWQLVQRSGDYADMRFADYTVSHPLMDETEIDPKMVNPSIAIRYASDDFWRLYKGGGFKKGKPGQLRALCKLLTTDPIYGGRTFCYGDGQYWKYASGGPTNGVPWTWRRDATNRHMEKTFSQL